MGYCVIANCERGQSVNAKTNNREREDRLATNALCDEAQLGRDHAPTLTALLIIAVDELRAVNANLVAIREAIERGGAADALVTPAEFASLLATSERELRRMRAAGDLPKAVGSARRPRWRRSDVDAFLGKMRAKR
jgi:predicted DNA-binding transcriptional regulator AlpA